jgi:hypothetical protein
MSEDGVGKLLAPAAWKARVALATVAFIATLLALDLSAARGGPTSQASQRWFIVGGIVGVALGVGMGLLLRARVPSVDEHRRSLGARATWSSALVVAAVVAMLRLGPILLQIGTMSALAGFSLALLPFVSGWFAAREGEDP